MRLTPLLPGTAHHSLLPSLPALRSFLPSPPLLCPYSSTRLSLKCSTPAFRNLQEWELPETLDLLDPRAAPNSLAASCLPPAVLTELEEIQSIGGLSHLNGVGGWGVQRVVAFMPVRLRGSFRWRPCSSCVQILAEIGELRRGVDGELSAAVAVLENDAKEDGEVCLIVLCWLVVRVGWGLFAWCDGWVGWGGVGVLWCSTLYVGCGYGMTSSAFASLIALCAAIVCNTVYCRPVVRTAMQSVQPPPPQLASRTGTRSRSTGAPPAVLHCSHQLAWCWYAPVRHGEIKPTAHLLHHATSFCAPQP
jgi:hypothetical protein